MDIEDTINYYYGGFKSLTPKVQGLVWAMASVTLSLILNLTGFNVITAALFFPAYLGSLALTYFPIGNAFAEYLIASAAAGALLGVFWERYGEEELRKWKKYRLNWGETKGWQKAAIVGGLFGLLEPMIITAVPAVAQIIPRFSALAAYTTNTTFSIFGGTAGGTDPVTTTIMSVAMGALFLACAYFAYENRSAFKKLDLGDGGDLKVLACAIIVIVAAAVSTPISPFHAVGFGDIEICVANSATPYAPVSVPISVFSVSNHPEYIPVGTKTQWTSSSSGCTTFTSVPGGEQMQFDVNYGAGNSACSTLNGRSVTSYIGALTWPNPGSPTNPIKLTCSGTLCTAGTKKCAGAAVSTSTGSSIVQTCNSAGTWSTSTTCPIGQGCACSGSACSCTSVCTPGWICSGSNFRAYQNSDCSTTSESQCAAATPQCIGNGVCVQCTSNSHCNDGSANTVDTCSGNTCHFTPVATTTQPTTPTTTRTTTTIPGQTTTTIPGQTTTTTIPGTTTTTIPGQITCSSNGDCPASGLTGAQYCAGNTVVQNFVTWTCKNAGTYTSYCSDSSSPTTITTCPANTMVCSGGQCYNSGCNSDGVCQATLGETLATCPADCKCGNGVCDAAFGETYSICPTDCPIQQDNTVYYIGGAVCVALIGGAFYRAGYLDKYLKKGTGGIVQ